MNLSLLKKKKSKALNYPKEVIRLFFLSVSPAIFHLKGVWSSWWCLVYFYKTVLGTKMNSPALPPESLGLHRDRRAGNKTAPLSQLVYPKGKHWGRFFPLSVPGKMVWICCTGHSTKHQVFTQMLPPFQMAPWESRAALVKKMLYSQSPGDRTLHSPFLYP